MKCRYCSKAVRNSKGMQKRLGLCSKCYEWDKKWVKEGIKYSSTK